MLGDSAICTGYGFASTYSGPRWAKAVTAMKQVLAGGAPVLGNLECVLSNRGYRARSWRASQMRGLPAFAEGLRDAGFAALSVANNHATQHGVQAFDDTVQILARAGVLPCGIRGEAGWCCEPSVMHVSNRRIGILAYCLRPRQYGPATPPYAEGSPEEICADVQRLSSQVDDVVVSFHWGEEFVARPSRSEAALSHMVLEAGARVLVGHHPHVARPVHEERSAVIAYSLGNFVSDMIWQQSLRRGIILDLTFADKLVHARYSTICIGTDYLPRIVATGLTPDAGGAEPLADDVYALEVERTVRAQRRASYRYAASRLTRFRFPTQLQLGATTLHNKFAALLNTEAQ